jgi:hypothetical protein
MRRLDGEGNSRSVKDDKAAFRRDHQSAAVLLAEHTQPARDDVEAMAATLLSARYGCDYQRGLVHLRAVPAVAGVWRRMAKAALAFDATNLNGHAEQQPSK